MKKVIVLMSTYNGEKYVTEQLESIIKQSYQDVEVYVRDDGSSDGTVEILEKYRKTGQINLIEGENIGFINSFFELIKHAPSADYYAFSDQDDIWKSEKIERAVDLLDREDGGKPLLYFSDYDYYDQDMKFVGRCKSHKRGPSFRNSLVDCISLGISCVFNKTTCELMKERIPNKCCGHDWWVYMICAGLGSVIYDKNSYIQYRRHSNNVSPGGKGFIEFQVWRIKKFLVNDYFSQIREQLKEFEQIYGEKLSKDNYDTLRLFTDDKHKGSNAAKKIFSSKPYRQGVADEVMLRFMFLIGKL